MYSSVIADAINRWNRISNPQDHYKFSTGTDEHGLKIQQTSLKQNVTPLTLCNNVTEQYKNLASHFSIDYTDFIRTIDPSHQKSVYKLWVSSFVSLHLGLIFLLCLSYTFFLLLFSVCFFLYSFCFNTGRHFSYNDFCQMF